MTLVKFMAAKSWLYTNKVNDTLVKIVVIIIGLFAVITISIINFILKKSMNGFNKFHYSGILCTSTVLLTINDYREKKLLF